MVRATRLKHVIRNGPRKLSPQALIRLSLPLLWTVATVVSGVMATAVCGVMATDVGGVKRTCAEAKLVRRPWSLLLLLMAQLTLMTGGKSHVVADGAVDPHVRR